MRCLKTAVTMVFVLLALSLSSIIAIASPPAIDGWTVTASELNPIDVNTDGKRWVLTSGSNENTQVYFSDDGLKWEPGTVSNDEDALFCWSKIVCNSEKGSWLILDQFGEHALSSEDGMEWTFVNTPEAFDEIFARNDFWYAYSETEGEVKASYRSKNGIDWEKVPEEDHALDLVSWNGGENDWSWVRGVMTEDVGGLYYSGNKGASWKKANIDEAGFGRPIYKQGFWIIGHFLGGGTPIYKSVNGLNWEPIPVNDFCSASNIEYYNGVWITQAFNEITNPDTGKKTIYDTVGYSKNGSDWKRIGIAKETDEFWLSYVGPGGIVVRNFNTGEYYYSDNAENWEPVLTCDLSIPKLLYNEASNTWILKGFNGENTELLRCSGKPE